MAGLCQTCQECPVVSSCGGGLYTHRYRAGSGFDNPSVYCADLLKLITHIGSHLPDGTHGRCRQPRGAATSGRWPRARRRRGHDQLVEAQRSLVRALLAAVYQAPSPRRQCQRPVMARLQAAWSLLTTLDQDQPEALDAVLGHPYVRAWAVRCLEHCGSSVTARRRGSDRQTTGALAADLGHLGAIAAAAAVRAGWTPPQVRHRRRRPSADAGRLVLSPAARARAQPPTTRPSPKRPSA